MKKILLVAAALITLSATAYSAVQYHSLGNVSISSSTVTGGLGIWQRTKAGLKTLTPSTTGQVVYCSDCAYARVCVSTGILNGAWVAVSSGAISECD